MLKSLAIANYRSIRELVLPLGPLNLITGPNGSGKSNLYRALRLLVDTVQGGIVASLAREGGLDSTLWAGPETVSRRMKNREVPIEGTRRKDPISLRLGFSSDDFGYAIDLGLPVPSDSMFARDPEIKRESIWSGPVLRPAALLVDRKGSLVQVRSSNGEWESIATNLATFDSLFTRVADPARAPEVLTLRDQVRSWRFYDHFRTDADAPPRQPQVGTRTTVLGHDGRDLAAALQTIREIGDGEALDRAVTDAFPGAHLEIASESGRFSFRLRQEGLLRPLEAAELSDGTLRYVLWIAALLTPRPPALMVLNEPETSLHPDLLPALARLIGVASRTTQVWVVCHASRLVAALNEVKGCVSFELEKEFGQTQVVNHSDLEAPPWHWPSR
jgi:predicted ATPase